MDIDEIVLQNSEDVELAGMEELRELDMALSAEGYTVEVTGRDSVVDLEFRTVYSNKGHPESFETQNVSVAPGEDLWLKVDGSTGESWEKTVERLESSQDSG